MVLSKVKIAKVEATVQRRRLLAEGISVTTEVAANDESAAQAVARNLTPETLNAQLEQAGLPQATILEAPTVSTSTVTSENVETGTKTGKQGSQAGVIAGAVLGALAGMGLLVAAYVYLSRHGAPQEPKGDAYDPEDRPAPRDKDSHDRGSEYVNVAGAAHARRAAYQSCHLPTTPFACFSLSRSRTLRLSTPPPVSLSPPRPFHLTPCLVPHPPFPAPP